MRRRPEPGLAALLLAGWLAVVAPCRAQAEQTIAYEPATVTLSGTLRCGTFVHPNGQHVPFWFLRLREPVRVPADPANSINGEASGVREVQVYSADEGLRRQLKRRQGHRVTLDGSVFHQHTAWHARVLVMQVTALHEARPYRPARDGLPESVAK